MYGRKVIGQTGEAIQVLANMNGVGWLPGGASIAWSLVAAVSGADANVNNGMIVQIGNKYLRYGQVLTLVRQVERQTVTITSATSGDFTLAGVFPVDFLPLAYSGQAFTFAAIPFDATAAVAQVIVDAALGAASLVVVGGVAGALTFDFPGYWGNVATMTVTDNTAGAGHSVAVVQTTAGVSTHGWFGPYDPNATDGRQTLERGKVAIVNETLVMNAPAGVALLGSDSEHSGLLTGGRMFIERIIQSGVAAASLAAGPTLANLLAAMPAIDPVYMNSNVP